MHFKPVYLRKWNWIQCITCSADKRADTPYTSVECLDVQWKESRPQTAKSTRSVARKWLLGSQFPQCGILFLKKKTNEGNPHHKHFQCYSRFEQHSRTFHDAIRTRTLTRTFHDAIRTRTFRDAIRAARRDAQILKWKIDRQCSHIDQIYEKGNFQQTGPPKWKLNNVVTHKG